jgi:hypothetical protein
MNYYNINVIVHPDGAVRVLSKIDDNLKFKTYIGIDEEGDWVLSLKQNN